MFFSDKQRLPLLFRFHSMDPLSAAFIAIDTNNAVALRKVITASIINQVEDGALLL